MSADRDKIIALIAEKHNPELAKRSGMVYQVWYDGEITLQKSGELLGMRNLHTIQAGITFDTGTFLKYLNLDKDEMPHKGGFAYVTSEDAQLIRTEIGRYIINGLAEMLELPFIEQNSITI